MNWPSARSKRASRPRSTVKRLPASLAAAAKSMRRCASPSSEGSRGRCSASPSSKCSRGLKSKLGGSPDLNSSLLADSSRPSGTSSASTLGRAARASSVAVSSAAARCSNASIWSRNAVASASKAVVSTPVRRPWPICLASTFRRVCASCNAVSAARRSASSAMISSAAGGRPRRARARSNAAGSARIRRRSCTSPRPAWFRRTRR